MAKMCIETVPVLTVVVLTLGSVTDARAFPAASGTKAANRLGVRAAPDVVRLKYGVVATRASAPANVAVVQFWGIGS